MNKKNLEKFQEIKIKIQKKLFRKFVGNSNFRK